MTIQDVINELQSYAPLSYQESYDNSGLLVGDAKEPLKGILTTVDTTEETVDEAIQLGVNIIVSHHPIIFKGLQKITGSCENERVILKAIQNNIALYAAHTNLDNSYNGVNAINAKKLGLQNTRLLAPKKHELCKLVTFVPRNYATTVRNALFRAGAGSIGEYDSCSFNVGGYGSFRAGEDSNPFVGNKGEIHYETEEKIETIFPKRLQNTIIDALNKAHPYEEVAYDIYILENPHPLIGSGMFGTLEQPMKEKSFLKHVKNVFNCDMIRHTNFLNKNIQQVAISGGSGSFLIPQAMQAGADVFISADIKYHDFFNERKNMLIVDIGHYESEQFTSELLYNVLSKKFTNFAVYQTTINTNPINYI